MVYIQDSETIVYLLFYNTTDATYTFTYTNGQGIAMGLGLGGGFNISTGEFIASGNTLTATIDLLGEGTVDAFWGYAAEYTTLGDTQTGEWWGDWIPGTFAPWYTDGDGDVNGNGDEDGGNGTPSDGTPGFEALAVIAALAVAFVILRRRK
jgi:PGF-CTERM protein